jgi:type IV secretory pathway VirJ component
MLFIISGDGGWTSFDQSMCETLAEKGIAVVGLDAQKYFWEEKSPEQATADISRAVIHYMQQWHKKSFVLVGYSFGACLVPFIANRMNADVSRNLRGIYAVSPDEKADFEIHITDMLSLGSSSDKYSVTAEIQKCRQPVYCFFGDEEKAEVRSRFSSTKARVFTLKGDHRYNGDYSMLANELFKCIPK